MTSEKTHKKQPGGRTSAARDITAPTLKAQSLRPVSLPPELPARPEVGRIILHARDPAWFHAYWYLTTEQHRKIWMETRVVLRIVELRGGQLFREVKQILLTHGATSWNFQIDLPARIYQAELGFLNARGRFQCVVTSEPIG